MMLDVMEQVAPDEAVLYLGGTFNDPALETEVGERLAAGLGDRVKLLGRIPPPELPRYLAAADVVWVPSQPDRQYSHPTVPTKLLEGMTIGLAALVSDMPGRGELVRLEECGLAVEPGAEGHLRGLRRLLVDRARAPGDGRSRPSRGRAPVLVGGGRGRFGRLLRFAVRRARLTAARRPDDRRKRLTGGECLT